jgi:protoheme IX farnesyltransferase
MKTNSKKIKGKPAVRLLTHLKMRLVLAKALKSFLISASALFAFIIKAPDISFIPVLTGISVFVLACGAATLNNYQDRYLDSRMQRTKNRPLPAGKISTRQTLVQAVFLILIGMAGLYLVDASATLPLLGALAILCYNFIYTPLKVKSMLAIFPGAVCGMLPPCIGWLAAGGTIDSITLWSIMAMFGLWQLPHYWLVLLLHQQDYRCSKVPNMLSLFSTSQIRKVMFSWVMVFAIMTLALPLLNAVVTDFVRWLILLNALYLVCNFAYQFFLKQEHYNYKSLLVHLNASLVCMMSLGAVDRVILLWPRFL